VLSGKWTSRSLSLALALMLTAGPYFYYRASYTHAKRLRPIVAGHFYRSGCMTAAGFRDAIQRYKIRTVINLMEEDRDPDLPAGYFVPEPHVHESELCKSLGAKMEFLFVDVLSPGKAATERPDTIDRFFKIMDNPASYPVLIHCKAGLHRTGVLSAVYRMEYQGWTRLQAWRELRSHGFGDFVCDASNDQVKQYVLTFQPGIRREGPWSIVRGPESPSR
jgi:hypothetical protein